MISIFLIAVSLALDAFAVSVSCGLTVKGNALKNSLLMGTYFGVFQFIMPLIGWFLGSRIASYVSAISPWIAFVLLAFIGGRMIIGTFKPEEEREPAPEKLTHGRLFVLAIATSIDALAVGVSFAFMEVNILLSCTIIGIVAFVLSVIGGTIGKKLGDRFQKRAELLGGIVLVCIGLKILLESLLGK
jgi:putative Mn2+ efflux pump MntP